jgi:heterogeneous nuclear ribonucleoprotein A1/A3
MNRKLYIGNLPYGTTETDVASFFSGVAEVEEIKIIMDRDTGRSRGFGFVTFTNSDDAQSALALNGQEMQGRRLVVNEARERKRR